MKKFIYDRELSFQFIIADGHSQIRMPEETTCWKWNMAHNKKKIWFRRGGKLKYKK